MDYIDRRRARLERHLLHAERSRRRKASRAWVLRERLARMPFGDLGAVASLAGGLEADAESAAAWRRRAVRCGKELAGLDAERAAGADVDGRRRFLAETGRCGRPTTDGSRWCAAHVDLWARGAAHAAGLWRFPEVLGDVVDFRPPTPVSADEMRQWAKSTADLLRLGFGALDEKGGAPMVDTAKPVTGPWVISIVPVRCPNDLAGVPDGYIRAWEEHVGPVEPAGGDREDWIEMCARLYWGVRNLGDDAIVRVHGRWRGDDMSLAGLPHFGHVLAHCQTPDQVADSSLASRYRLNPVVRGLMHRPSETCSIDPPDVRAAFARLVDRGVASFLVKYAVREKALPNLPLDGADPDALADRVAGWLAEDWESMRAEGVPDALLVQKRVRMEYEYRMFMVGDEPVCGAGNIGVLTPVDNEARFDPKMQRTRADMDRSTVERRPDLAERYRVAAVRFGRALAGDGYGAYVLDLCLIDGEVSIVELNGMMNAGLFALDMDTLTRAMRVRPDRFVPVSSDLLAGRDACPVPV